ncbi:hypothetical protein EDF66_11273 [Sphingobacterium sp. JUb20]|nr:hypothetical protein [Sphingobacterium sp. JUb21]TCR00229.1 hypothetical protein EDF66_11273 [Sphingobacterium sp. JUb20]
MKEKKYSYTGGGSIDLSFFNLKISEISKNNKRYLPCSMVEREKLRDPKLREDLSICVMNLFKFICFILYGFWFLTPTQVNDKTNIKTMNQLNKYV